MQNSEIQSPDSVTPPLSCGGRKRFFLCAASLLTLLLLFRSVGPVRADDGPLTPIHLHLAGREWAGKAACLADDKEVYLPLEVLKAVGARGEVNEHGDAAQVTLNASSRHATLALARPEGEPMVVLSDLARLLNATIVRSEQTDDTGKPIPGSAGDTIYLLARLTDVRVDQGALRITTSFPIPFHVFMIRDSKPPRGYIDCVGADAPESFHPTAPSAEERRVLRLRVGQFDIDTARVVLELTDRVTLRTAIGPARARTLIVARLNGRQPDQIAAADTRGARGASAPKVGDAGDAAQTPATLDAASTSDTLISRPSGSRPADPPAPSDPKDPGEQAADQHMDMPTKAAPDKSDAKPVPDPDDAPDDAKEAPSPPREAPRVGGPLEVRGIEITPDNDNEVHVHLDVTRHTGVYVHYVDGGNLAVEVPGAVLNLTNPDQSAPKLSHPLLRGLTAEQETQDPPAARITLLTPRVVGFTVNIEPNGVMLDLRLPRNASGVLADKVIVVDPGHGGFSTGATAGPIKEKNIVLSIALKLRAELEACGAKVVMTRDRDVYVGLDDRPILANAIHADLFVSVHNDSNGVPNSASGTSTYYHFQDPSSRALAHCVQQTIIATSGLPSRGALSDSVLYHSGLAVLRLSKMPAVLVEVAYINNHRDRVKLLDADFQHRIAKAICDGVRTYVEGTPQTARK